MPTSFVAYIDEAGDEGFAFEKGSSEWFIISAVVARSQYNPAILRAVDHVRGVLGRLTDRDPIHFRKLEHHKRLPYVGVIPELEVSVISVLVHKPSLTDPKALAGRNALYFAAAGYLAEGISRYCREERDSQDAGDGTVELVFSHRSDMTEDEVRGHLQRMRWSSELQVDGDVIRPERAFIFDPKKRVGLQIADAVASSLHFAVSPKYGYTEPGYAKMLRPVIYGKEGKYLEYGLVFWPKGDGLEELLRSGLHLEWVRTHYS